MFRGTSYAPVLESEEWHRDYTDGGENGNYSFDIDWIPCHDNPIRFIIVEKKHGYDKYGNRATRLNSSQDKFQQHLSTMLVNSTYHPESFLGRYTFWASGHDYRLADEMLINYNHKISFDELLDLQDGDWWYNSGKWIIPPLDNMIPINTQIKKELMILPNGHTNPRKFKVYHFNELKEPYDTAGYVRFGQECIGKYINWKFCD
jgi:hypothetical protein